MDLIMSGFGKCSLKANVCIKAWSSIYLSTSNHCLCYMLSKVNLLLHLQHHNLCFVHNILCSLNLWSTISSTVSIENNKVL